MDPTHQPVIFDKYRKELWGALKVSHEQYDKALLTLSGGGLAISITLVKELFPADKIVVPWLLVVTWALFCGSIILTIISFLVSQKALHVQLENFDNYTAGDDSFLNKKNPYSTATTCLNRASGTRLKYIPCVPHHCGGYWESPSASKPGRNNSHTLSLSSSHDLLGG